MSDNLRNTKNAGRTRRFKGGKGTSRRKKSAAKKIQSKTRKRLAKKKSAATKLQTRARMLKAKSVLDEEKEMAKEISLMRRQERHSRQHPNYRWGYGYDSE